MIDFFIYRPSSFFFLDPTSFSYSSVYGPGSVFLFLVVTNESFNYNTLVTVCHYVFIYLGLCFIILRTSLHSFVLTFSYGRVSLSSSRPRCNNFLCLRPTMCDPLPSLPLTDEYPYPNEKLHYFTRP